MEYALTVRYTRCGFALFSLRFLTVRRSRRQRHESNIARITSRDAAPRRIGHWPDWRVATPPPGPSRETRKKRVPTSERRERSVNVNDRRAKQPRSRRAKPPLGGCDAPGEVAVA